MRGVAETQKIISTTTGQKAALSNPMIDSPIPVVDFASSAIAYLHQ
jgi:hypothetical protein